jgi:hypothetical protein
VNEEKVDLETSFLFERRVSKSTRQLGKNVTKQKKRTNLMTLTQKKGLKEEPGMTVLLFW